MANPEHLAILKQGVDVWNQWRQGDKAIRPDLIEADLSNANLKGMELRRTSFNRANLSGAQLNETDLRLADLSEANLTGAMLIRADLTRAKLIGADLTGAKSIEANLFSANPIRANFNATDLSGADLRGAGLVGVNLSLAILNGADLSGANLSGANLNRAELKGVNLSKSRMLYTLLVDVNLSEVSGLDTVNHEGPSSISIATIYLSQGKIPHAFLRGAGVPENLIIYMASLTGQAFEYYSVFISHSSQDQAFAERLHADLQAKGVRCWYAPHDLKIGSPYMKEIDRAIRVHDKSLLILSENSVQKDGWVEWEVTQAETVEMQPDRKPEIIFPVRIDDTVMQTDIDWATRLRSTRHIGDFTTWKSDHDAYQQAFDRLLRDLQQSAKED